MRLLLDTRVLLWCLADSAELSADAREAIADGANEVVVSAASAWEIAIKQAAGKLRVPEDFVSQLEGAGFVPMAMSIEHGLAAGALPEHHRDPFDRMLVAQAQIENLTVVTRDDRFALYGAKVLAT